MSRTCVHILLLLAMIWSGVHASAPAAANESHHATDIHLHADASPPDSGQDDGDTDRAHGSHHNCPVAPDLLLTGAQDMLRRTGSLLFARPASELASRAPPPLLDPPLA